MDITYIYLVENCYGDPNKIYIGKTKNSRKDNHKITYGKNIEYTIIDEVNSFDSKLWKPIETMWIQSFISWGFNVLNKQKEGGSGVSFHKDSSKLKMSQVKKGMKCTWGDKISKSTLLGGKLKNSRKKWAKPKPIKINKYQKPPGFGDKLKKPRPIIQKKIIQFDLNNKLICEFNCIKEAINKTNIKGIYNCLRGRAKSAGNYIWKYK